MQRRTFLIITFVSIILFVPALFSSPLTASSASLPWWLWTVLLILAAFFIGIIAVPSGIGGGVLFVPLISAFFPFNIDFVRAAGLFISLAGALTSLPILLEKGFADIRLAIPPALAASVASLAGALLGLRMNERSIYSSMGIVIIVICVIMMLPRKKLDISQSSDTAKAWSTPKGILGLFLFCIAGFMAGVFGIGVGWGNVAVLNLIVGLPVKFAAGSSAFIIGISGSSAGWVYLLHGAFLPLVVIPSVAGMSLGSRVGVRFFSTARPGAIRLIVSAVLLFSGIRALLKGLGIWI